MRSGLFLQTVIKALIGTLIATTVTTVLWSQNLSKIEKIEPVSLKVGGSVTLHGEGLGKKAVVAVFLCSAKDDFPATVAEQSDTKIVITVPKVAPGDYKIGIQVGQSLLVHPLSITIEP